MIGEIVGFIRVLVMREAKGGGAKFFKKSKILFALFLPHRPAAIETVLVKRRAVQIIGTAIQNKSLVRIHIEGAKPERLLNEIENVRPLLHLHEDVIEIGIEPAIPKVRLSDSLAPMTTLEAVPAAMRAAR